MSDYLFLKLQLEKYTKNIDCSKVFPKINEQCINSLFIFDLKYYVNNSKFLFNNFKSISFVENSIIPKTLIKDVDYKFNLIENYVNTLKDQLFKLPFLDNKKLYNLQLEGKIVPNYSGELIFEFIWDEKIIPHELFNLLSKKPYENAYLAIQDLNNICYIFGKNI